jgi:hypothetical protein
VQSLSRAAFDQPVVTNVTRALQLAMSFPPPLSNVTSVAGSKVSGPSTKLRFTRRSVPVAGQSVLSILPLAARSGELVSLLRPAPDTALALRVHMTDNLVDALPGDGTPSGWALLILGSSSQVTSGVDSSVLLNSNELRAAWTFAVASVHGANNFCITGNLILNQQAPDATGKIPWSLMIDPPQPPLPATGAPPPRSAGSSAVTGNVFEGNTNLSDLQRPDIVPFDSTSPQFSQLNNWKFFNFEPLLK